MKKTRIQTLSLLLLSVITGCGACHDTASAIINFIAGDIPDGVQSCEVECFNRVHAELAVDCSIVQQNVALARKMLDEQGTVKDNDFCAVFNSFDLYISSKSDWTDWRHHSLDGQYFWYRYAQVSQEMDSMMHEMLHFVQLNRDHSLNPGHPNWDKKGWWDLDKNYDAASKSPVILETPPPNP